MLNIIGGALLAFFAIIGFTETLRSAAEALLKPRGGVRFVLSPGTHDDNVEYRIRSLVFRASALLPSGEWPLVVVVDNGMDAETRKICELLSKELGCVGIFRGEELPGLLGAQMRA